MEGLESDFGYVEIQDEIGVFMTAITSRRKKGTREREEGERIKCVWIRIKPRQNRGLYDRYSAKEGERNQ